MLSVVRVRKSFNPAQHGYSLKHGFTLIELLITITIIGILAAIIIPSYNGQVQRTRREDAMESLLRIAQALEVCRSDFSAYNDANCNPVLVTTDGLYNINLVRNTDTFTITATAPAGSSQLADVNCRQFSITNTGLRTAQNAGGDPVNNCWP